MTIHLVEISEPLIDQQELELCGKKTDTLINKGYLRENRTKNGIPIFWHRSVDTIPKKVNLLTFIVYSFFV